MEIAEYPKEVAIGWSGLLDFFGGFKVDQLDRLSSQPPIGAFGSAGVTPAPEWELVNRVSHAGVNRSQ